VSVDEVRDGGGEDPSHRGGRCRECRLIPWPHCNGQLAANGSHDVCACHYESEGEKGGVGGIIEEHCTLFLALRQKYFILKIFFLKNTKSILIQLFSMLF
jgi:hypothetical protein